MTYVARRVPEHLGELTVESEIWLSAARSPRFVNIVNGRPATYRTHAAVLWSSERLYVKYWAQEPFLHATFEERDSLLFNENNVELFIDGGDVYYELEISARNVLYEVLFIWQDGAWSQDLMQREELDPVRQGAYTFGGNHDRNSATFWDGAHPRGLRWAYKGWRLPGLRAEVALYGTLNDDDDEDDGWEVMLAIPWQSLELLADGRPLPPVDGDEWRFQFARYERLRELDLNVGWAWTPVGSDDNHAPEKFTPVRFSQEYLG